MRALLLDAEQALQYFPVDWMSVWQRNLSQFLFYSVRAQVMQPFFHVPEYTTSEFSPNITFFMLLLRKFQSLQDRQPNPQSNNDDEDEI
jgi:hypothetical protein